MSKEDILENLYLVWGTKPIDHMFNGELVQFYSDLCFENITSDEYKEYARKQNKEGINLDNINLYVDLTSPTYRRRNKFSKFIRKILRNWR